jgi:hypothetical protein
MLYGRKPRLPGDRNEYTPLNAEAIIDRLPQFETACREARRLEDERAKKNKQQWEKDNKRRLAVGVKFKKGDHVLVRNEGKQKFNLNWYRPYEVLEAGPHNTYKLRTVAGKDGKKGTELPRMVNGDRLHKVKIQGKLTKSWHLPKSLEKKRQAYRNDQEEYIVPEGGFEPLPEPQGSSINPVETTTQQDSTPVLENTPERQATGPEITLDDLIDPDTPEDPNTIMVDTGNYPDQQTDMELDEKEEDTDMITEL